ncbi:guanylate kinase [Candidatus Competibacter denitrificans Run_A_D11]|uniref:Guanylate kinase n=2 Tax=Candidatus Competibacter TaxID=221279 RepID=W6MDP2_9GAMM|nr:guanylate kinase [Candidatus Competibacter denitrificans Run_A_D11]
MLRTEPFFLFLGTSTGKEMTTGNLYIVAAPSGAGKTSLVNKLVETTPGVVVSVSHTTRSPRPGEKDGTHYHFVSMPTFKAMLADGLFLEQACVFDHCYGTSRAAVSAQREAGLDVILEIDWQGARQVRTLLPECASIFILPPSRRVLYQRLMARGQDSHETIDRRMAAALDELSHYAEFDYLVVNDRFDEALDALRAIVIANRQCRETQLERQRRLLQTLLS